MHGPEISCPKQLFIEHYDSMLSYVCLLQYKSENKLIFDEEYALLGCHYSTTNLVYGSWFLKCYHPLLRPTVVRTVRNLHFKMLFSPLKSSLFISLLFLQGWVSPKHFNVVQRKEPGCRFEGTRTCITSNYISLGISSSWGLCLSKTQKSKSCQKECIMKNRKGSHVWFIPQTSRDCSGHSVYLRRFKEICAIFLYKYLWNI